MICNKGKILKTLHTYTYIYTYIYILRMSNLLEVNDFHISAIWRMLKQDL